MLVCLHFCSDRSRLGNQAHFEDKLVQNWGGPLDHFLIGSESYNCGFGSRENLDQPPRWALSLRFSDRGRRVRIGSLKHVCACRRQLLGVSGRL